MGRVPRTDVSRGLGVLFMIALLTVSGCSLEWEGPHIHMEESYIVPPGTELLLSFPGDRPRDIAIDYDAADSIRVTSPPPHHWISCPPYRKVACEVHGPIRLHNESWSFHEISVRAEPSPSPLCRKNPVPSGDLIGLRNRNPGMTPSGGRQ